MASVRNAFDLLSGGGGAPAALAAKKKKSKKKGPVADGGQPQPSAPAISAASPAGPIAAPRLEPAVPQQQSAKAATEALEAAAVAAGAGEHGALALEWAEQVLEGDVLFAEGNQLVEFEQVLVKSRALDLLLEGCLARGATAADGPALAALLAAVAHPSVPLQFTQALADTTASLGQLAATDRLAPTLAAKRSAAGTLALVKRGIPKPPAAARPAEAPATKLNRLARELGQQEARLGNTTQPKELCKAYSHILEVLCSQLDVLRPAGATAGAAQVPALAAALRPLEELRAALATRLQEVQAPPKPVLSIEEQVAEAEAAHKKEDAAIEMRLSEAATHIASLESELAALKGEAGELRQRRAAAAQHHQHKVQQIESGKADSGASAADVAAAVQGGLGALDGLVASIRSSTGEPGGGGGGKAQDTAVLAEQVVASEVPVKLLGAMQQVVELNLQQLHDQGSKARFYRERLQKAIKQGEQAAKLGVGDPKASQQQRITAENNVKDVLAAADASAAGCRAAVASYRERLPLMLRLPSFLPPPPEYLQAMEARAAEAEHLLEAIHSGTYVPPAPPAAAPVAALAEAGQPGAAAAGVARVTAERLPKGAAAAGAAAGAALPVDLDALEQKLAMLEAENQKKDAQIAAMVSSSTLEVPSPLAMRTSMPPAMLSSPSNNKPVGPAAPIAPAAPAPAPAATGPPAPAAPAAAAAPAAPVITFSQALAAAAPAAQANGQPRQGRMRRA